MAYAMIDTLDATPLTVARSPESATPIRVRNASLSINMTDDEAVKLVRALIAVLPVARIVEIPIPAIGAEVAS